MPLRRHRGHMGHGHLSIKHNVEFNTLPIHYLCFIYAVSMLRLWSIYGKGINFGRVGAGANLKIHPHLEIGAIDPCFELNPCPIFKWGRIVTEILRCTLLAIVFNKVLKIELNLTKKTIRQNRIKVGAKAGISLFAVGKTKNGTQEFGKARRCAPCHFEKSQKRSLGKNILLALTAVLPVLIGEASSGTVRGISFRKVKISIFALFYKKFQ